MFSLSPFPLAREPTVTAWRGTTLSARIDKCRTLIMPPRFVRQLRNNMAQSLVLFVKLGVRFARRRCGSCSVFEVTHSVTKCARTGFRIRLRLPQLLIINYHSRVVVAYAPIIAIGCGCPRPYSSTKPTILRNCGLSSYPCLN